MTLSGHDTSYGPDGQYVNDREGYTYTDADNAVNQPKFQPMLMVGLTYQVLARRSTVRQITYVPFRPGSDCERTSVLCSTCTKE